MTIEKDRLTDDPVQHSLPRPEHVCHGAAIQIARNRELNSRVEADTCEVGSNVARPDEEKRVDAHRKYLAYFEEVGPLEYESDDDAIRLAVPPPEIRANRVRHHPATTVRRTGGSSRPTAAFRMSELETFAMTNH